MVHLTRLELARIFIHMDLNHTRLPIPPYLHILFAVSFDGSIIIA